MKALTIPLALVTFAAALPAQDLPAWVLTLSRLKRQAREEIGRLPNYSCLQTIKRQQRRARDPEFKTLDVLRLEVAFIDGQELFAPAGASEFRDLSLSNFISSGSLGTGAFTSVARNLFVHDSARTTGWGEEKLADREAIWYGFEISPMFQSYRLSHSGAVGYAGERGKFWVDAATLELLRIQDDAYDIPPALQMRAVTTTIDYGRVPIGETVVRLPQVAEMVITEADGSQNRNITSFSACREYGSRSAIHFDDATPPPAAPPKK